MSYLGQHGHLGLFVKPAVNLQEMINEIASCVGADMLSTFKGFLIKGKNGWMIAEVLPLLSPSESQMQYFLIFDSSPDTPQLKGCEHPYILSSRELSNLIDLLFYNPGWWYKIQGLSPRTMIAIFNHDILECLLDRNVLQNYMQMPYKHMNENEEEELYGDVYDVEKPPKPQKVGWW